MEPHLPGFDVFSTRRRESHTICQRQISETSKQLFETYKYYNRIYFPNVCSIIYSQDFIINTFEINIVVK